MGSATNIGNGALSRALTVRVNSLFRLPGARLAEVLRQLDASHLGNFVQTWQALAQARARPSPYLYAQNS